MLKFIFLGLVQGLTEFIPVSSSAHLVIFQNLLGVNKDIVFLDTVLHLGTLFSLIIFFRTDLLVMFSNFFISLMDIIFNRRMSYVLRYDDNFRMCIYIMITTLITGFIGLSFKDFFESQFVSVTTVILGLFFTAVILFLTKNFNVGQRLTRHILIKDSILLGLTQGLAIIPGISRSGITISTLLFRNVEAESAFRFSFLISIPVIFGAFILKLKDALEIERVISFLNLGCGFFAAFISGLAALYILRFILKRRCFYKFSYYCFFLSLLVLFLKMRGVL